LLQRATLLTAQADRGIGVRRAASCDELGLEPRRARAALRAEQLELLASRAVPARALTR
jgi:hypothetical protein